MLRVAAIDPYYRSEYPTAAAKIGDALAILNVMANEYPQLLFPPPSSASILPAD